MERYAGHIAGLSVGGILLTARKSLFDTSKGKNNIQFGKFDVNIPLYIGICDDGDYLNCEGYDRNAETGDKGTCNVP